MSEGWRPIADLPEKPEGKVLLATARRVLGLYSGRKQIDGCDIWFIDDALYDGGSDPEFFFTLPPLPR